MELDRRQIKKTSFFTEIKGSLKIQNRLFMTRILLYVGLSLSSDYVLIFQDKFYFYAKQKISFKVLKMAKNFVLSWLYQYYPSITCQFSLVSFFLCLLILFWHPRKTILPNLYSLSKLKNYFFEKYSSMNSLGQNPSFSLSQVCNSCFSSVYGSWFTCCIILILTLCSQNVLLKTYIPNSEAKLQRWKKAGSRPIFSWF